MIKRPLTVNITLIFILLNALVWLLLGILILTHAHPGIPDIPYISNAMAVISIILSACLVSLSLLIARQNRWAYLFTLAFLAGTALLTIFDDVGLSDLVVIILILIPVILLIKDRKWFLQNEPKAL